MQMSACALALALVLVLSSSTRVDAQVAEIGVMFWSPAPELVLSADDLSETDLDEVDFVQEFGIEEKRFPEFRAAIGRAHKFRVSFIRFGYDAEATIRRTFTFRNRTFTIGAPARSDVTWDLWKFGYQWDFVSRPQGSVGVIADLKYNRVRGAIDSPVLSSAAETEVKAYVPTVGVAARGYLAPAFAVSGELTGLRFTSTDFVARFVDFDVYAVVFFGGHAGAQAGYRSVDVEYLIDNDEGRLQMTGPYFGGILRF